MKMTRSAYVNLGFFIVFLLVSYSGFSHIKQVNNINTLTEEFLWQVNTNIQDTVRNYLRPAELVSEVSSNLIQSGSLSIDNRLELEAYVGPIADNYSQLKAFYVGTEEDEFWMWLSRPNDSARYVSKHVIASSEATATGSTPRLLETLNYYNEKSEFLTQEKTLGVDYRATQRPWYNGAKRLRSGYWTDVYVFNTTQTHGITGAYPIFNEKGDVYAVWGVDIEIAELSQFLADISISRLGEIAIFSGQGNVVAYSGDMDSLMNNASLPDLYTLGSQVLVDAVDNYANHGFGHFFINSGGERYLASVAPFSYPNEQDWQIVIAIPESGLLGDLLWRTHLDGLFVFLLMIAAVLLLIALRNNVKIP